MKILRISYYATASTDSAAYIIGGSYVDYYEYDDSFDSFDVSVSTIAQFKNNKWLKIGDLNEKKSALSAIFHDGEYLIVGGWVDSGRLVNLCKIIFTIMKYCFQLSNKGRQVTLYHCDLIMTNNSTSSGQKRQFKRQKCNDEDLA